MNMQKSHDGKDSTPDKGLDELGRAYRDLGSENPPDMLDQAVLNRAHREVEKKTGWMQFGWLHGLTTAAVIVLAFSIVLQQREPAPLEEDILLEIGPPPISNEPERNDRVRQAAPTAAVKLNAEVAPDSDRALQKRSEARKEGQVLESLAGAPAAAREQEVSLEEEAPVQRTRAKGVDVGEADFYSVIAPREAKDKVGLQDAVTPEQRLAEILDLKNAGDESWKKALEDFRQQYPDYPIPEELLD